MNGLVKRMSKTTLVAVLFWIQNYLVVFATKCVVAVKHGLVHHIKKARIISDSFSSAVGWKIIVQIWRRARFKKSLARR